MFGESFDLAAVASAAGLGGGAISAVTAAIVFKGIIMRFFAQMLMTTALTGAGFLALLHFLGFEIVPKDEAMPFGSLSGVVEPQSGASDSFQAQSAPSGQPAPAAEREGAPIYYVKSPFRKS